MISKTIAVVLVCVLLHTSVAAEDQSQSQTQTVDKMQQVLHKAQERNKPVKVTLRKKIDNQRKFTGRVVEISDAEFAIADQKSGKAMTFKYDDVQQVGQTGMSTGTIITIGALVAGGLIILGVIYHEVGKD
jgi:Na+-transporting NADH:ubiquinone oxidoreductase subunit NqrC